MTSLQKFQTMSILIRNRKVVADLPIVKARDKLIYYDQPYLATPYSTICLDFLRFSFIKQTSHTFSAKITFASLFFTHCFTLDYKPGIVTFFGMLHSSQFMLNLQFVKTFGSKSVVETCPKLLSCSLKDVKLPISTITMSWKTTIIRLTRTF